MQSHEPEMIEITERVWDSLLEVPLSIQPAGEPVHRPTERAYTSCVHISGAWEGAVWVYCSEVLARMFTGAMLAMPPAETTDDDVRDALGELANMVGGNVKALLPEPCGLSLPTVAEGFSYRMTVSGTRPVTTVTWTSFGEPLVVQLLERDEAAGPTGAATAVRPVVR